MKLKSTRVPLKYTRFGSKDTGASEDSRGNRPLFRAALRWCWVLCLGLSALAVWAQPTSTHLHFTHVLPEEVASLSYINTIAQDSKGFMWFGGANGLGRYDGYQLTIYRHDPDTPGGLSHSYINHIVAVEGGDLWLATRAGIDFFDADTSRFSHYRYPGESIQGSRANDVRDIVVEENQIWSATRGGLVRYDRRSDTFDRVSLTGAEEEPSIMSVEVDRDGVLWLGTQSQGVYRYHPESGERRNFRYEKGAGRSIPDNDVREIYVDVDNDVWFGTYGGGLARYERDTETFEHFPNDQHEKGETVWAITRDSEGTYWIGDGFSVSRFDPVTGRFESHSYVEGEPRSPGNHVATAVFEDQVGDIWVGYSGDGIDRIDRTASAFENHAHDPRDDNSITDGGVVSTLEAPDGDIWIGTGYGLNHWDRQTGTFTRITMDEDKDNTLSGNTILDMEQQGDTLWLGIWSGGLNRMDLNTGEVTHYLPDGDSDSSIPGAEPWGLTLDRKGTLWMATDAGVARYNASTDDFTTFQPDPDQMGGDRQLYTRTILEDSRGQLWVGAISGLYRLDRDTGDFTRYAHDPEEERSLSENFVVSLYEDSRGDLWVGTERGGLNRFDLDKEVFKAYTTEDGLPNDSVTSIVEDPRGDIWVSTHKGLSRLELNREVFSNFGVRQGVVGNMHNRDAGLVTDRGEVLFGSSKGFTLFDPADLHPNTFAPPIYITDVQVMNEPVRAIEQPDGRLQSIPFADTLTLQPDESVVTFGFSALNYRLPESNRYSYRLLGFEEDWNWVGTRRSATYTNLDPGEYVLQVKGANNDGLLSDRPAELTLRVLPPLWQTWWAYGLYALGLLILVSWLIRNQRRKLAQEREVVKRLRQVDELKDEFLANTSHELRTPLNGIVGLAESLAAGATGVLPESTRFNLGMIASSGRRLAALVDDILDFSRLRNQTIELRRRPVDLHVVVDVVLTLSRPLLGDKPVELVNAVPEDLHYVYADEDRLLQILHNLVGNAVKFTEQGSVTVKGWEIDETDEVAFSVSDTGVGIPHHEFEHLFDSFYQVDKNNTRLYGGTGLGLSITHHLVGLHGGRLEIESAPERGSTFTVTMPRADGEQRLTDSEATPPTRRAREVLSDRDAGPDQEALSDQGALSDQSVVSQESTAVVVPNASNKGGAHILIVDDEPINRQVLVNYLALGDFKVSVCDSGEAALAFVEQHSGVDLVLLDVMMPKLSGYETCRVLRERYSTLELPVIFLTARRQTGDLLQAFAAGGNDFLSKPFSRDELLARVKTHLHFLDTHRNLDKKVAEHTSDLKQINQGLEQAQSELKTAYRKLEEASFTDPLTGLGNRRYLSRQLPLDISLCVRHYRKWLESGGPVPVESDCVFLLVDIDDFKPVNDNYGHSAGDRLLEQLSNALRGAMRESDYIIRWGGEEFLLVGRFTARSEAPLLAERVRAAIEDAEFTLESGEVLKKTGSVGYAAFPFYSRQPEALSWEQVIDTADRALYAAKRAGRNCWVGLEEGEQSTAEWVDPRLNERLQETIDRGAILVRTSSESGPLQW